MLLGAEHHFRPECGVGLYSKDSSVVYLFATLFYLPTIPLGCYRVQEGSGKVLKEESWKIGEVLFLYLLHYIIPAIIIAFVIL